MARISRQPVLSNSATLQAMAKVSNNGLKKTYQTAIYARLSIADSGKGNGDSIETQIDYLKYYMKDRLDLELTGVYCDNGYTGTSFLRPEWNRLMEDMEAGKINCIIVKDLSRFGRDYIETGDYLEHIFPLWGIRFIAVNDHYDSIDPSCNKEGMIFVLKNMVNDFYAKDISKKVTSSTHLKQRKGEYQGAHPPYGYLYSMEGTHKLVIDGVTAPVVKQIYNWILEGYADRTIVNFLKDEGLPSPGSYFYQLGFLHSERYANNKSWTISTIKRIAANQLYLGHMVRGKTEESLYRNIPRHNTSEAEWIIIPNTHEAIISEELFHQVQEVIKLRNTSPSKPIKGN